MKSEPAAARAGSVRSTYAPPFFLRLGFGLCVGLRT